MVARSEAELAQLVHLQDFRRHLQVSPVKLRHSELPHQGVTLLVAYKEICRKLDEAAIDLIDPDQQTEMTMTTVD